MKSKALVVLFGLLITNLTMGDSSRFSNDILRQTFGYGDESKHAVELSEIHQGCRARDCIPSIDAPQYGSVADNTLLEDDDVIMLVKYNGVRKAYPLKIMQGHEVVNDHFNEKPLAVTYCPLCASAVAFVPIVDGQQVEFGVSGLLHNSDLILYDRQTYSLWGQITGRAIVGPKTGVQLKRVYVAQVSWAQVKKHFSDLQVLQPPKGSRQNYRRDYYERYLNDDKTMFPVALKAPGLKQKVKVHGFTINEQAIAVSHDYLVKQSPIQHHVNGHAFSITLKSNGLVEVKSQDSGKTHLSIMTFWFAWYNFHPDTELIR